MAITPRKASQPTGIRILKPAGFTVGVLCIAAGVLALVVGSRVTPASTRSGFLATGAGLLLVALPAALPCSPRLAKALAAIALGLFALAMPWIGFGRDGSPASPTFRVAAAAFAALLSVRIGWAMRQ